jgi:hypothetical protein
MAQSALKQMHSTELHYQQLVVGLEAKLKSRRVRCGGAFKDERKGDFVQEHPRIACNVGVKYFSLKKIDFDSGLYHITFHFSF